MAPFSVSRSSKVGDRRPPAGAVKRAPQRLAVDGEHTRAGLVNRLDPGDETALEPLGIQGRKQVSKLVMRWRGVLVREEAAQKTQLPLAEKSHIHPTLGAAEDRNQVQQQNPVKRIKHFPFLAGIVHSIALKENANGLATVVAGD